MSRFAVIIAAAGRSSRFGQGGEKKPFVMLGGKPVWQHSVELFRARRDVGTMVMVVAEEDRERVEERFRANLMFNSVQLVVGGEDRADSVKAGLAAIDETAEFVVVHDAARPCVKADDIDCCFAAALRSGAAILAAPVTSTVKRRDRNGMVVETLDRSALWLAQTPQVARRTWLIEALSAPWVGRAPTDEAEALERMGRAVEIVAGSPSNLKLTTSEDLAIAKALLGDRPKSGLADLLG